MLSRRPVHYGPAGLSGRSNGKLRLLMALGVVVFSLISYCNSKEYNPVTGENQYISLTPHQEIALGLQSTPEMIQQYGGLHPDQRAQNYLDQIGMRLVQSSAARDTEWRFDFHLLADPQTINAFALPGGQCFITAALYSRLETEGQLAGVLGHEIGHVVARHSSQRIAKANLTEGLTQAVMVASGDARSAQVAAMIGQIVNMKYGRDDELQSDYLGVQFMSDAGYDPRAMIKVMEILRDAGGGSAPPEFFSTHPNPDNRIGRISSRHPGTVPEWRARGAEAVTSAE